jgi:DedD protein
MDAQLKTRLIGATVIIGLIIVFLPMFLDRESAEPTDPSTEEVSLDIPPMPASDMQSRTITLSEPAALPESVVEPDQIAQIDTRRAAAPVARLPSEQSGTIAREPIDSLPAPQPREADVPAPAPTPTPAQTTTPSAAPTNSPQPRARESSPRPAPNTEASAAPTAPRTAAASPGLRTASETMPKPSGGRFGVNFGSYSSQENATRLVTQLQDKGVQAGLESVNVDGKALYRVAARGYSNKAQAELVKQLASEQLSGITASVLSGEPATPSAPANPASDPALGQFAVQVGVFSDAAKAQELVDQLKAKGFPAFLERLITPAGTTLRVRVGPTLRKADAESIRANIKAKAKLDGMVVEH